MELLVCAILFATDDPAAAQAIHYARQAEGLVRSQTSKWKTLEDVTKAFGHWKFLDENAGSAITSEDKDQELFVWEFKDFGVTVRCRLEAKNGSFFQVVDVNWHFQPFNPTAPQFHVLPPRQRHRNMTIAGS